MRRLWRTGGSSRVSIDWWAEASWSRAELSRREIACVGNLYILYLSMGTAGSDAGSSLMPDSILDLFD